jgi:hypothetical protein
MVSTPTPARGSFRFVKAGAVFAVSVLVAAAVVGELTGGLLVALLLILAVLALGQTVYRAARPGLPLWSRVRGPLAALGGLLLAMVLLALVVG